MSPVKDTLAGFSQTCIYIDACPVLTLFDSRIHEYVCELHGPAGLRQARLGCTPNRNHCKLVRCSVQHRFSGFQPLVVYKLESSIRTWPWSSLTFKRFYTLREQEDLKETVTALRSLLRLIELKWINTENKREETGREAISRSVWTVL